jgi:hypothetical protein
MNSQARYEAIDTVTRFKLVETGEAIEGHLLLMLRNLAIVYGGRPIEPVDEENPWWNFGASKTAGRFCRAAWDLGYNVCHTSNLAGMLPPGELDRNDPRSAAPSETP